MSAELSNKVNQLCQKVKNLSKRETSDSKKEYLFAKYNFDPATPSIVVSGGSNIPYDNTLASNCITLNSSGGAVVSSSGVYEVSFLTHPNQIGSAAFAVAVNGVVQDGTQSYNKDTDVATAAVLLIQLANSVILELNAGDVVTIVNTTLQMNGTTPKDIGIQSRDNGNSFDTNLSIHKI